MIQTEYNPIDREGLAAISRPIQMALKMTGEDATVNQKLLSLYSRAVQAVTGSHPVAWRTVKEWNARGMRVKKGEKAFKLWSAPKRSKADKTEAKKVDDKTGNIVTTETFTGDEARAKYFLCCLFCDAQTE